MGVGLRVSGLTRVMPVLANEVEYCGDCGMDGLGPVGARKGKPGTTNSKQSSGLEAMVGDQGTTGDDVGLVGYWRRGLPGLGYFQVLWGLLRMSLTTSRAVAEFSW